MNSFSGSHDGMPNGAGGPAQAAGAGMNGASMARSTAKTKIIKRYQNRKLYDTQQSCYVTLDDIAKMIRLSEDVVVIDNKSKNDITAATLTQIIFESEKKASQYAPLFTLREIIQNGNGSISGYLAKLGAIPKEYAAAQAAPLLLEKPVAEEVKQSLENRVAKAAAESADYASKASRLEAEEAPNLPTSSGGFNG